MTLNVKATHPSDTPELSLKIDKIGFMVVNTLDTIVIPGEKAEETEAIPDIAKQVMEITLQGICKLTDDSGIATFSTLLAMKDWIFEDDGTATNRASLEWTDASTTWSGIFVKISIDPTAGKDDFPFTMTFRVLAET